MTTLKLLLALTLCAGVVATAKDAAAKVKPGYGRVTKAPELAGKGSPAALALIVGGAAIVASRRRKRAD